MRSLYTQFKPDQQIDFCGTANWLAAWNSHPEPRKHVRGLITLDDLSYCDPDTGVLLYHEISDAWWEDDVWYLSKPSYMRHMLDSDFVIVWWQYKSPHPGHLKPKDIDSMLVVEER